MQNPTSRFHPASLLLLFTPLLLALVFAFPCLPAAADVADYQARTYRLSAAKTLNYRLFVPKNLQAGRKYPLMLHMHGAGERGTNNTNQLNHVFSNFWADDSIQKDNPSFVVAPQCPPDPQRWIITPTYGDYDSDQVPITDNLKAVLGILDSMAREFPIDPDRVYISGMSMGGCGTWYSICQYTSRFAAAVPVCGGGDNGKGAALAGLPIWVFHAVDDPSVPIMYSRHMVDAIKAAGGTKIRYTEYPASMGLGHESWKAAAKDPQMWRWVYQQSRATVTLARRDTRSGAIRSGAGNSPIQPGRNAGVTLLVDALGQLRAYGPDATPPTRAFLPSR